MSLFISNEDNNMVFRRSSRIQSRNTNATNLRPIAQNQGHASESRMNICTTSSEIQQHQRQSDVSGHRSVSNDMPNHPADSNAIEVGANTRSHTRSSRHSSARSVASNHRRRLEIQLEFTRRKQEQELRQIQLQQQSQLLEIEEAVELAIIDEQINNSQTSSQEDVFESIRNNEQNNFEHVSNWVEEATRNRDLCNHSVVTPMHTPQSILNHHVNGNQLSVDNIDLLQIDDHSNINHEQVTDNDLSMINNVNNSHNQLSNIHSEFANQQIQLAQHQLAQRHTAQEYHQLLPQTTQLLQRSQSQPQFLPQTQQLLPQSQQFRQPRIHQPHQFSQPQQTFTHPAPNSRIQNIERWITRQSVSKDLPKFSGDPLEWAQFITQYETSTQICNLSNVENQSRLLKCLSGSALSAVQPLLIYPQNVNRVIEILRNRFGRNECVVHLLLDRVRNFNVLKEDKVDTLLQFFDIFSNMVYTLESLNEWDHIRNPILFSEILNKLPLTQRIDFNQYYDGLHNNEPKILELHKWLERRVNAASKLFPISVSKTVRDEKCDSKNQKSKAMTFAINANTKPESNVPNYSCFYCKNTGHGIYSCNSFKNLKVDEKWDFITTNKACISCLKPKHSIKQCKKRKKCIVNDCKYFHNYLLHKPNDNNIPPIVESKIETNCHVHFEEQYALLKIIPVTLKGPKSTLDTFAMLDDGSTVTLIDSKLASQLGLDGPTKHLRLQWTNDQYNDQTDSKIVSVDIKGGDNGKFYTLRRAKTISDLNLPSQSVDMHILSEKYPYLNPFKHLSYKNAKPMIIIGQDNWPVIVTRKVTKGFWNGPTISKTLLGWVLHGNVFVDDIHKTNSVFHIHELKHYEDDKDDLNIIQDMIKQQWSFDIAGTVADNGTNPSVDDKHCLDILNRTVKRVGNRFETGIFWNSENVILPESKTTALKRLACLEKKMSRDSSYAQIYTAKMEEYITKGYIKKLSIPEAKIETSRTWYLPHFGVVNPNKPGKLRIVFDAAAKTNGCCLNDFLLAGLDLYNSLQNILMNFRIKKFAFIGDIKEMFLQIKVVEQDRQAQRIFWRGSDKSKDPDIYEIQVVFFGAKCSPSIAQEIKVRNAKDFQSEYPQAVKEINDNHYMDDYLGGADTEEQAIKLIHEIITIHKNGGFDMVNWISNSPKILESLDENMRAKPSQNQNLDGCNSDERVLGMWWDFSEDNFKYRLKFDKIDPKILNYERRPTKRDILKIVMSIFDPLGFLSNLIIVGKILMQNIWENGIGWDDQITDSQNILWREWSSNFKNAMTFRVPRLLSTLIENNTKIDLHVFCDASKHAYAAVAYLRIQHNDNIHCVLINSKARVAPLKPITIPRLELQAAVLGCFLSNNIKKFLNLNIDSIVLWSDSITVLSWIKSSSKRFKTFVSHRIGEIHDMTEPSWWKYIPSKLNIADDATKNKPIDFSPSSIWLNAPEFLSKSISHWPQGKFDLASVDDSEYLNNEHLLMLREKIDSKVLPDIKRFSNWNRYIRTVAWIFKYIGKLKILSKRNSLPYDTYELLPEDIIKAELFVFRKIQQDSYPNELASLYNNRAISKNSSLSSFSCFLNADNLICVSGRLNNSSEILISGKQPVILDSKHDITKLMVRHYHEINNHIGTEKIISDIRMRFWVTNIRSLVKRIKYECQYCKNIKAVPQIPVMGQLPSCRVDRPIRPFIKCGIDYFGPIEVTVNRHHEKRYGVIFTCMSIRAIHIEIAQDLSFNSFLHVLIQFGNRRGFPDEIFSDNGGNFIKANTEIQKALNSWPKDEIVKFCTNRQCKWTFNPPLAPHMGGAWERLIQSIKKHLFFILHERYPREFVLRTLLCEVEGIINNRPITHNSIDPNDDDPLTPNNFLIGLQAQSYPFKMTTDSDLTLLSMWNASQRLADIFWKRWVSEYLPSILLSRKWKKESKNVAVNDVVLIVDPNNPRNVWPKGIIERVYPAADGRIRIVDVKTNSGIYRRSISKIVKLDIINESNSSY